VRIEGAVLYPGFYAVREEGEWLSDVIQRAGGFTPRALLTGAAVLRHEDVITEEDSLFAELDLSRLTLKKYSLFTMEREFLGRKRVHADFVKVFHDNDSEADILVRDGDVVLVPEKTGYVQVLGEVVSPGYVPFTAGQSWKYYVRSVGGLNKDADRGGVYVSRYSIDRPVPAKHIDTIHDGDVIIVTTRKDRDMWQFTREFVALLAQVITIYIIVDQALQ
jgi:protein involved in polysaccharide export with SLBB domain